jgi:catechol 2,3-dioxygenase-like lactoylglutathione lyase family enzyme
MAAGGKEVLMRWTCVIPNVPVRDVPAAQEWYRETLGLDVNWIWQDNFGSVGSGYVELFLYESDDPKPVVCSVFVDDVDAIYERSRGGGGEIVSELELKPWDVREFSIRDPDGNVLRIGQGAEQSAENETLTTAEGAL